MSGALENGGGRVGLDARRGQEGLADRSSDVGAGAAGGPPAGRCPEAHRPLERAPAWVRGFSERADPALYVPRDATDRALGELARCIAKPGQPVALCAPPGLGKTLMLRLLEHKLRDKLCCIYLPYGAVGMSDLCAWVLGELDRTGQASDALGAAAAEEPARRLEEIAEQLRIQRSALLLLVDDVTGMPADTARALGQWARRSRGAFRLVLAACDDSSGSRVVAASRVTRVVRLRARMTERESAAYVRAQLDALGAPWEVVARATPEMIERIHRLSVGVPRLVQRIAAWELCDPPTGVKPPWGEDDLSDLARDAVDPSAEGEGALAFESSADWEDPAGDLAEELPESVDR